MSNPEIGKKYGRLTITDIYQKPSGKRNRRYARCICDCGKEHEARFNSLKNGVTRSCGCSHKTYLDEIGKVYGYLTIKDAYSKRSDSSGKMITHVVCDCKCGTTDKHFQLPNIKNLGTRSCGCVRREKTYGLTTRSREYKTWRRMYKSCTDPKHISYPRRGGQGIGITPERHSFKGRWEDNKDKYDEFAYFTRKNPFKDFTIENCVRRIAYNVSKFDLFEK